MNSESKPSSSTVRANALIPRARSGPSPSQTYEGRKTPNRPISRHVADVPLWCTAQRPRYSGSRLSKNAIGALEHVVAGEDPFRGVELGGEAGVEVAGPHAASISRFASRTASGPRVGDLAGDLVGRGDAPRRPARPR